MRVNLSQRVLSEVGILLATKRSVRQQSRMKVINSGFEVAEFAAPSLPASHHVKLTLIYRKEKVIPVPEGVKLP
jgi:hypothetical protein